MEEFLAYLWRLFQGTLDYNAKFSVVDSKSLNSTNSLKLTNTISEKKAQVTQQNDISITENVKGSISAKPEASLTKPEAHVGSQVCVSDYGSEYYGKIRWIGNVGQSNVPVAGIELVCIFSNIV